MLRALGFANSEFIKEEPPKADIPTLNVIELNTEGVDLRPLYVSNPEFSLSGKEVAIVDMIAL